MICEERSWSEFRETGLLWWINMILHTFGWVIVIDVKKEKAYPARAKCRGFSEKSNTEGYIKVSQFIKDNADTLLEEAKDE